MLDDTPPTKTLDLPIADITVRSTTKKFFSGLSIALASIFACIVWAWDHGITFDRRYATQESLEKIKTEIQPLHSKFEQYVTKESYDKMGKKISELERYLTKRTEIIKLSYRITILKEVRSELLRVPAVFANPKTKELIENILRNDIDIAESQLRSAAGSAMIPLPGLGARMPPEE